MTRLGASLALILLATVAAAGDAPTRELLYRVAIAETMQKYVWSVDSLDAAGYAAVFTEDGEIDSNGTLIKGRAAIARVVTDLKARQQANREQGKPAGRLYHVISNERIEFVSADVAIYRSYWQTLRKGEDARFATGGFGRSEDRLARQRDGRWLIESRKLTVFTE